MPELMKPEYLSSLLHPGMTVFVQGASGEPTTLIDTLATMPEACAGVEFISCQIPGLNRTDFAGLHPEARFTGLFVTPELVSNYEAGKMRLMPFSYSGMYRYLEKRPIDLALIQVAPTERRGVFSLGSSVHFVPAVLKQAKTVVAEINETLPSVEQSVRIDQARLNYILPTAHPLSSLDPGPTSDVSCAIGAHIAGLVSDGDCIQIGIGKIPNAALDALHSHRGLACRGGLISDAMIDLQDAGAFDPVRPMGCTSVIGTDRVYDWVRGRNDVHVMPVRQTHDVLTLANIERFVAINSALAVDLGGQADAETLDGRQVGGCGGLPDFVQGARLSKGGRSILALPSTAGHGKISRIVPYLDGGVASIPRSDVDYVVTEHGIAKLGYRSLDERAEALIEVADPKFRNGLVDVWEKRKRFGNEATLNHP